MTIALSVKSISGISIPELAILLSEAIDITLVIDIKGKIQDLALSTDELLQGIGKSWRGRAWSSVASEESGSRIDEIIDNSKAGGQPMWREVNHYLNDGTLLPIRFYNFPIGETGKTLALGKDLRSIAVLQQQLLNAQQSLEQDYWRLRQVETRYRLIFDMVADAVVVVDEPTNKVLEVNPVANHLLSGNVRTILGKTFPIGFNESSAKEVQSMLAETRITGKSSTTNLRILGSELEYKMSAILIRQDNESRFLIRLSQAYGNADLHNPLLTHLEAVISNAPDAVIITNAEGQIQYVNSAFLNLAQLASEEQAVNKSIEEWLGRTGVDLNILLNNLNEYGSVKLYASSLHGSLGLVANVEISATVVQNVDPTLYVMFIRDVGRRVSADVSESSKLPRSVEYVTQQVGRLPLKEIVRESTDLIEKNCIETALTLTGDNRASAAELLGLSRQSLYAKLRIHQINDISGVNS